MQWWELGKDRRKGLFCALRFPSVSSFGIQTVMNNELRIMWKFMITPSYCIVLYCILCRRVPCCLRGNTQGYNKSIRQASYECLSSSRHAVLCCIVFHCIAWHCVVLSSFVWHWETQMDRTHLRHTDYVNVLYVMLMSHCMVCSCIVWLCVVLNVSALYCGSAHGKKRSIWQRPCECSSSWRHSITCNILPRVRRTY